MAPLKKRDKDANAANGIAAGSANLTATTLAGQSQQQQQAGDSSSAVVMAPTAAAANNNSHNHNGTNGNNSNSNNNTNNVNNSMTNSNINNNNNNNMTNNNIESNNNTNGKDLNRRDSTPAQRGTTAACPDATTRFSSHPDTEIFLQAFEKPTQIYRFLRNRQVTNPLFLNRSLSYMRDRMSRSNKKRANFKASAMLQQVEQRISKPRSFLNIIYSGVYDESEACDRCYNTNDLVNIDANLVRIIRSKRKEGNAEIQEVFCETSQVTYNPKGPANRYGAVSLDMNTLCSSNEHVILKLLFSMKAVPKIEAAQPAAAPAAAVASGATTAATPSDKKSPYAGRSKGARKTRFLCSEMILVERSLNGLQEGEYETLLQEAKPTLHVGAKRRTWESMPKTFKPEWVQREAFGKFPALKFHVMWSSTKLPSSLTRDEYKRYTKCDPVEMEFDGEASSGPADGATPAAAMKPDGGDVNHNNNNNSLTSTPAPSNGAAGEPTAATAPVAEEPLKIVYNFMYNNNTNQKTEYTHELLCPWCSLDCMRLYPLLKHLKLCHPRFNFTYHPLADNTACIDVTINDTYDGSYAGSPYDLAGPAGSSFARTCGPVRRTTVTNLLVCRPRRQKSGLEEFMALDEDELNNQRPYITGHNRLYHHTETCLPVQTKELDIDSEGESDPLWLRQKTIQMIDEFSDVNEGEKELMKLWNLHVMKHGFVGDCQLKLACEMFLQKNGIELIKKNLYRNFILHMCSLFDYGLVAQETLYMTVQKLQQLISQNPECQSLMVQQHQKQVRYWQEVGMHRQEELKLKSPQKVYTPAAAAATKRTKEAAAALAGAPGGSEEAKSKSADDGEAMQPPPKRASNGAAEGGRHSSKAAKKVAAAEESQAPPPPKRVGRKSLGESLAARRSEAAAAAAEDAKEKDSKRRSTGMLNAAGATTEDGRRKRLKRQLSFPDLFSTMPASKRKRPDATASSNNNNGSSSSSTSNTRASNNNNNQNNKADQNNGGGSMMHASPTRPVVAATFGSPGQQGKRGAARRQSAAGQTDAKKFEGKTTASGHTLRARLSLEKR